jgi:DNA helicase-2/ATP-dependent DNA helicase PcrA
MKLHEPTEDKKPILESDERIRVVRAVPGSGKTWLVGEAIRRELDTWNYATRGIATLSFTNVARDEIRTALGYELTYPHFVGTLDSFIYRYIARPFARLYDPQIKPLHLVPAENAALLSDAQRWAGGSVEIPVVSTTRRANLFRIQFVGEDRNGPIFSTRLAEWEGPTILDGEIAKRILNKKLSLWRRSGRVSHPDVSYIAYKIISHPTHVFPRELLVRRFPFLIVDELQDTGWYLGRILQQLLQHQACRALLVGDPDQAIYEFNGARPELFEEFENISGARIFPINTTARCPKRISRAAAQLASTGRRIESNQPHEGTTILAVRDGSEDKILELCDVLQSRSGVTAFLTRANSTIQNLKGGSSSKKPNFSSTSLMSLHNGINAMRLGNMKKAYACGTAALARPLLGTDVMADSDFEEFGIDPFQWKKRVVELLIQADNEISAESLYDWGCRMKYLIDTEIKKHVSLQSLNISKSPRRPPEKTKAEQRIDYVMPRTGVVASDISIQTVHAVKGETHHTTVLYVPRLQANRCPSVVWWSSEAAFQEERRIAFVAATRAADTFILCVHLETYERLLKSKPAFVEAFEVKDLTDLIAIYRAEAAGV